MDAIRVSQSMSEQLSEIEQIAASTSGVSLKLSVSQWFIRQGLRLFMVVYAGLLKLSKLTGSSKKPPDEERYDILLTGTFYSDNWIISHLKPLAMSRYCRRIQMVTSSPLPPMEKVEAIYPPALLVRVIGKVPARLLKFLCVAIKGRPHIVGGFHMLPNGLIAVLTAQLIRAKSLYFCGGGPREIIGGGYLGNPVFAKLKKPDYLIERILLGVLSTVNLVITMGSGATKFFKEHADTSYHIIPGGFDRSRFYPANKPPENDLILIGILTEVKRVDIFLQAVKLTKEAIPNISAIVVGSGPLLLSLRQMAHKLRISENVKFVGHQDNVGDWLRRSRIFVLTSDSEGVSQAMIQAMLCGLPPVVSDVGDLGDLVTPGLNGYLISSRKPEAFAECFIGLLKDSEKLNELGKVAYQTAVKYTVENVSCKWDNIFKNLRDDGR